MGFDLDVIRVQGVTLNFTDACNCHDMCFYASSDSTSAKCDKRFWRDLRILCDRQTVSRCTDGQCTHSMVSAGVCGAASKALAMAVEVGNQHLPEIFSDAQARQRDYQGFLLKEFRELIDPSHFPLEDGATHAHSESEL